MKPLLFTCRPSHNILYAAAPFGFGPTVAVETLHGELVGPPEDLYSVAPTDVLDQSFDLFCNVGSSELSPRRVSASRKVWIDCLAWLRRSPPRGFRAWDITIAEGFFSDGPTGTMRYTMASPLVGSLPDRVDGGSTSDVILVSFGGMATPYSTREHLVDMPAAVLSALVEAAQSVGAPAFDIACFVPERYLEDLRDVCPTDRIMFRPAARDRYLETLATCRIAILQPGLYGPLEAFSLGVPTAFTFPMSYTQYWQACEYCRRGLMNGTPLLEAMMSEFGHVGREIEESEPQFFRELAAWWRKHASKLWIRRSLREWARSTLRWSCAPSGVREARRAYAREVAALPSVARLLEERGLAP